MKTWMIRHVRIVKHAAAFAFTLNDAHRWEVLHYRYTKRFTDIP